VKTNCEFAMNTALPKSSDSLCESH